MDLGETVSLNGKYGVTFAAWVRFDSFPGTAYLLSLKASDGRLLRIYSGGTSQKMTTMINNDGFLNLSLETPLSLPEKMDDKDVHKQDGFKYVWEHTLQEYPNTNHLAP